MTDPAPPEGKDLFLDAADTRIPVHQSRPSGDGPWPGVVVVHDALGMTSDLRAQADWLASHGFLAVAPDLYHRGGRLRCMFSTLRSLAAGHGQVFEDLEVTRSWLAVRPECTGRVGIIGFCMGGNLALMLACSGRYESASVNYGDISGDSYPDLAQACPVVGSYGGRDRSLRDTPARLERALEDHGVDHDIVVYPNAGHGFLNDHRGETPLWALVAGWYANTGYDEAAADAARKRIVAFFDEHLAS
jgi:carboxymethylenebutenolidase